MAGRQGRQRGWELAGAALLELEVELESRSGVDRPSNVGELNAARILCRTASNSSPCSAEGRAGVGGGGGGNGPPSERGKGGSPRPERRQQPDECERWEVMVRWNRVVVRFVRFGRVLYAMRGVFALRIAKSFLKTRKVIFFFIS